MPPSNKITTRATITTSSTVRTGVWPSCRARSDAIAAHSRKNAGAGTLSFSLSRFDMTAAMPVSPASSTGRPNVVPRFPSQPRAKRNITLSYQPSTRR